MRLQHEVPLTWMLKSFLISSGVLPLIMSALQRDP
jgi:hypothetical protein